MRPRRATAGALHGATALAGVALAFYPTLLSGFRRVQTDPGDTLLNAYVLEHSWQCVSNKSYAGSLWSPAFFHPTREALAYSENLLGTAPLYWGLRLGCSDLLAFQLWMMLAAVGTYAGMAGALRWLGVSPGLCAAGGCVFSFGAGPVIEVAP